MTDHNPEHQLFNDMITDYPAVEVVGNNKNYYLVSMEKERNRLLETFNTSGQQQSNPVGAHNLLDLLSIRIEDFRPGLTIEIGGTGSVYDNLIDPDNAAYHYLIKECPNKNRISFRGRIKDLYFALTYRAEHAATIGSYSSPMLTSSPELVIGITKTAIIQRPPKPQTGERISRLPFDLFAPLGSSGLTLSRVEFPQSSFDR